LISSLNHVGSKADAQYGKGRELRLIDGELEVRLSDRFPVYAVVARTSGAGIRAGEWRHVALVYAGGKNAAGIRVFVDGAEVALQVRYDGLQSEPPKRDFLIGADNAENGSKFRGALDEVRSFPRALSAAAVRARFMVEALPLALAVMDEGKEVASRLDKPEPLSLPNRQARSLQASSVAFLWLRDALLANDQQTAPLVAQRTRTVGENTSRCAAVFRPLW